MNSAYIFNLCLYWCLSSTCKNKGEPWWAKLNWTFLYAFNTSLASIEIMLKSFYTKFEPLCNVLFFFLSSSDIMNNSLVYSKCHMKLQTLTTFSQPIFVWPDSPPLLYSACTHLKAFGSNDLVRRLNCTRRLLRRSTERSIARPV